MTITVSVAQLKKWNACMDQVEKFKEVFGTKDVTVTRRRLHKAAALQLDIEWWFRRAVPALYDDYEAKVKPLDDDHEAKVKPLYDDYLAKRKLLDDDYEAKVKPLYDDYLAKKADLIADMMGLK